MNKCYIARKYIVIWLEIVFVLLALFLLLCDEILIYKAHK